MALPSHYVPNELTFEAISAYHWVDDYMDLWEEILAPAGRLTFIDKVAQGEDITQNEYYWTEDLAIANYVTLTDAMTDSATTLQVSAGDGKLLQTGDLLYNTEIGKSEWMQVDSVNTSTGAVTVARGFGSSSGEAWASGLKLYIQRLRPVGSSKDTREYQGTRRKTNYVGILSHTVGLDGSTMTDIPRGGYSNELDRQEAKVLTKLKWELEDMLLFGPGEARASSALGAFIGIKPWVIALGGSNYSTTAETASWKTINEKLNWIVKQGQLTPGDQLILLTSPDGANAIGQWGKAFVQTTMDETTLGFQVNTLKSTLGLSVPVVWHPGLYNEYWLIPVSRIKRHPRKGRGLIRMRRPLYENLEDSEERRILAEWGASYKNLGTTSWIQTNVTFE